MSELVLLEVVLLNNIPMEDPIIVAVLNHAQGTLDLIEVNHLDCEKKITEGLSLFKVLIFNHLEDLGYDIDDIDWMVIFPGAIRFHSSSDWWNNMCLAQVQKK